MSDWTVLTWKMVNDSALSFFTPFLSSGPKQPHCVGRFCGHIENSSLCGACPWGSRAYYSETSASVCLPCFAPPDLHGWLYLGFITILPVLIFLCNIPTVTSGDESIGDHRATDAIKNGVHEVNITVTAAATNTQLNLEPRCHFALLNTSYTWGLMYFILHLFAALLAVLLFPPIGRLSLHSCVPQQLDDFYSPLLAGPGCASEAAFPYTSLPMAYYALCALGCIGLYGAILSSAGPSVRSTWSRVIRFSLYAYPILCMIVFLFGGLLYFTYPYVLLIVAVLHSVCCFPVLFDYCASCSDESVLPICNPIQLMSAIVFGPKSSCVWVVCLNALCYGYSLLAQSQSLWWVLTLMFLPFLFYVATLPFTHPFAACDGEKLLQLDLVRSSVDAPKHSRNSFPMSEQVVEL
ncbi:hypothetical protein P879_04382 [Paragonimus westermani]|uniref:JNK1/MAPK8-associated membrane protein n=1 Tax=Paragonimus westermani TaxID=34504 RepID=A0A8T0DG69_9TREM|nr:hypothetical protein P879_04382 [Paragonimus westermani]